MSNLPPLVPERAIARGSERSVFDWPEEPGLLIKVLHANALRRDARGEMTDPVWCRERHSWLMARAYAARTGRPPPVAEVIARLPTAAGSLHVVRKVADCEGRIGPTLHRLAAENRVGEAEIDRLNALVADLMASGIAVHDARAANFVFEAGPGRAGRFVLVDGFGDRAVVPLRSWLPFLARRRLSRALCRTARETGLAWDGSRFSRP
ncbi:MAG: YrbL family protein [Paracoccaceae bacterium]|nr:YrbL family protein [Paracoccaceae bacterium]